MDWAELDLAPPYPSPLSLSHQLSSKVLSIDQRRSLISHSLSRACLFADLTLLTFLVRDPIAKTLVDLKSKDEDGLCVISQSIIGFGDESERAVDREECIRLLVAHGSPVDEPDLLGWTPLHHAALRAPPTLIVHLLAHGASPLALTHKSFTPLDLISAYQPVPNRQDVTLILRESMREQGWQGSALELRRDRRQRLRDAKKAKVSKSAAEWSRIGHILGIDNSWWGESSSSGVDDIEDLEELIEPESGDDLPDESVLDDRLSPPPDYTSMLVFSLSSIPDLLQRIIVEATPTLYPTHSRSAPANTLYYLARFASLYCDDNWLDSLMTAALDCIEACTYAREDKREDLSHTAFWLYNSTLLLHLLKCDRALSDLCESLDIFFLLEELIKSLYAFILRGSERKIQGLIQPSLLDHSDMMADFESIQFESDWSFFRSLTPKRKPAGVSTSTSNLSNISDSLTPSKSSTFNGRVSPNPSNRPPSPSPSAKAFSSIRQTINRANATPLANVFPQSSYSNGVSAQPSPTPSSITAILSSLHSLLRLYSINPIIIVQAFSQIYYWIACETFNKIIVQKKYLCRSRAMQIGLNISVLEEWVTSVGLPSSVSSHFQTLRELLIWLQCHSSIDQFTSLIDTIQTMKSLNPVQMRRAVRDYRYEVNEPRMDEECVQYLGQLQKDWERRRVRMGVEALQKEFADRNRDRSESIASTMSAELLSPIPLADSEEPQLSDKALAEAQEAIDRLFDRDHLKNEWVAPTGPTVLGELMDTAFPLRLILPSDPELLAAWPGPGVEHLIEQEERDRKRRSRDLSVRLSDGGGHSRSASRASIGSRGAMEWRMRTETVRVVTPRLLYALDGGRRRPMRDVDVVPPDDAEDQISDDGTEPEGDGEDTQVLLNSLHLHASTFTKRPQRHSRIPRESSGADTVVPIREPRDSSRTPDQHVVELPADADQ